MENQSIKRGDFVRHKVLNKAQRLYVANVSGINVLVRYNTDSVFYSETFFYDELEHYPDQSEEPLGFFVG